MITTGSAPDLNGKMVSTPSPSFATPCAGSSKMAAGGDKRKKMVIKPFKVQPKLPENFEDDTWEKLQVQNLIRHYRLRGDRTVDSMLINNVYIPLRPCSIERVDVWSTV